MTYLNCEEAELLKIINQEDIDFASNVKIPYGTGAGLWARKHFIDEKINLALASGVISEIERVAVGYQRAPYQISDYIPSGDVKSMADGKMYDSKSQYYKSLKEKGMVIVDEPQKERKPKEVDWKQAIAETINRVGA